MLRGETINVALNPIGAKQLRDAESFVPAQLELRNGVRTDAGFWKGRPGAAQWWQTHAASPIILLIPRKWQADGNGFAVTSSGRIYELKTNRTVREYTGTTLNGDYRPTWCEFDGTIIITDGQAPVKIDAAGTTVSELSGSPPAAKYCAVISDRVVLAGYDATEFRWSDAGTSSTWTSTNVSNVTGHGEQIRYMTVANQDLYFFKDFSVEIWSHIGGNEVFGRKLIVTIADKFSRNRGIPSFSVVQGPDGFYFFCDGDFWKLQGAQGTILSSAYKRELGNLEQVSTMYGFHCAKEHVIRWFEPVSARCFVYDYVNDVFTEDNEWEFGEWQRLPMYSYMEVDGVAYMGDYDASGLVYKWSDEVYSDDALPIRMQRKFRMPLTPKGLIRQGASVEGHQARLNRLRLRFLRGQAGTGTAHTLSVRWALDEGDWTPYTELDLGEPGDADPWVDIHQLGVGREVKVEIVQAKNLPHVLTHALLTVQPMGR